jgi:DNA-binding LytR/AlgR family response regulator
MFLTSNADAVTIDAAKKVNPPAYLIKPFSEKELFSAIEITLHNHAVKKDTKSNSKKTIIKDALFVKDKGALKKIEFKDIIYIKSSHVYLEITMTSKRTFIVRMSLNKIITKLSPVFLQVHRSYIINANYLTAINNTSLNINEKTIPIGKKYKKEVFEKITIT